MLTIENLTTRLGDKSFAFSLQAKSDEVCAILGKSGSGKSTLLNLIAGFLKPRSGTMSWQQQSLLALAANERPVTSLFQQHNLFSHLTVAQNIGLGVNPKLKLSPADHDRISQVLREVGMDNFESNLADTLSGGEQQRVALARCLLRNQPILLLDEPFSALDEATRHEMIELTRQVVAEHQLCVVLVTHNKDDAEMLNARMLELVDGELHDPRMR